MQKLLTSPAHRNIALVDRTGDIELAAKEIASSRTVFGGSSRHAVDLVLVNEFVADKFVTAAAQHLRTAQETINAANGVVSEQRKSSAKKEEGKVLEDEVRSGKAKWLNGNATSGLIEITNRDTSLATSKLPSMPIVIIDKITSMDDAIDFLAKEATPINALYLFSGPREAKYLSQFITSQGSFVNHIPAHIIGKRCSTPLLIFAYILTCSLVGPTTPIDYPINLRTRYTHAMFERPSPQVTPGPKSHLVSSIIKQAAFIDTVARKELKPTGQPKAEAWGFFEVGMALGFFTHTLPIALGVLGGTGWAVWKGIQMLRAQM